MLRGKKLSILGDSISTYKGVSNDKSANHTIVDNAYFYRPIFELSDTYWGRLLQMTGMTLCVNNSWSGGNLSGRSDLTSGVNRARNLCHNNGDKPDVIIVFMGINDVGRGIDPEVFREDYIETLRIIKADHPDASVFCVNLPDRDIFLKKQTEVYNNIINEAVSLSGDNFYVVDLFSSRLNNDYYYNNTLDGLHPDKDGMRIISEIIEGEMLKIQSSQN